MALYTKDSVERVKQAIDIVELVGARVDLRRVGSRHTGLCPFHDERTPSFSVNPELGLYHCFGCGASGDGIRFVQESEGLDFREAIEHLADRYRVEMRLEHEDPRAEERRRRHERLLALLERAADFYARFLWMSEEAEQARSHLAARGLDQEVLQDFQIGFSPAAWDKVIQRAQRDGYSPEELVAAGLAQRGRRGGLIDRFRGRIMFPLADARGRVLGFGARAVAEEQRPKYLNTSENELYHKGRQLFGIDRARAAAAATGRVVAVEGYTDVLALHQAGLRETVAIMGTALTQEQMAELHRAAGSVFLALDADSSGQEAMLRAGRGAKNRGLDLRVVPLPDGRDPADLVAGADVAEFRRLLDGAISVVEFEVRRVLSEADLDTAGGRDRALDRVRPLIASTGDRAATRDELVRYVADRLDVPTAYLMTQLTAPAMDGSRVASALSDGDGEAPGERGSAPAPREQRAPTIEAAVRAERAFLAMCVAEPGPGREYLDRLGDDHLTSESLRRVRRHLAQHLEAPLSGLPSDDPALVAGVEGVVMFADEQPWSEAALRVGFLQLDLRRIERALVDARGRQDFRRQRDLWTAREEARERLSALMGEAV